MKPSQAVALHNVWVSMWARCTKPETKSFPAYGGRGIKVCDRWRDFDLFAEDMGPRPAGDYQIDRVDNDGDYEPDNCRWATRHQQSRNRRSTLMITLMGRTQCAKDWAAEFGLKEHTFRARIRRGWGPGSAGEKPAVRRSGVARSRAITANGETLHLAEWARRLGCNPAAILYRLQSGMSEHDAVTLPIPERPNSKLTLEQARLIRAAYPERSSLALAADYGVSKKTILNVVHERIFRE